MAGVTIRADSAEVQSALAGMRSRLGDLSPVMQQVAGVLADEAEQAFEDQRDPSTLTPWEKLAGSTIATRTEARTWPGRILQVTGQLASSVSQDHGADFAVAGSNLVYAAIHQLGGAAGRGGKSLIPARPFLGLSPDGEEEILDLIGSYLEP